MDKFIPIKGVDYGFDRLEHMTKLFNLCHLAENGVDVDTPFSIGIPDEGEIGGQLVVATDADGEIVCSFVLSGYGNQAIYSCAYVNNFTSIFEGD